MNEWGSHRVFYCLIVLSRVERIEQFVSLSPFLFRINYNDNVCEPGDGLSPIRHVHVEQTAERTVKRTRP